MVTILIIEDNFEIRENISEMLELAGYDVIVAPNGKSGIDLALKKNPDIILCDIMMPELSGYEVFNELRENSITKNTPFIFVTASAEKSEVQAGLDMGAAGYIRKPFDEKELLDTLEKCLVSKQ